MYAWTDSLATGNATIDSEHKNFILLEVKNTWRVFDFCVAESQAKPDFLLADCVGGGLALQALYCIKSFRLDTVIKAINDVLEACSQGHGRDKIAETLKFLGEYTHTHFAHEEQLQKDSGYPDIARHKTLHAGFVQTVARLTKELNQQGATISLMSQVNSQIGQWILQHIKREDVKVAQHIKSVKD